jgi:predicted ATPase
MVTVTRWWYVSALAVAATTPISRASLEVALRQQSLQASCMSTPAAFVGRHSELRILGDRLADAERGHPQVVYLEGEAGGGKTTLLSVFLGSLSNAVVLEAGGDEAETLLSYGIIVG